MLTFTCDYCETEYKTHGRLGVDSKLFQVTYEDGNKRETLLDPSSPCAKCERIAEDAKKEALEKRKKK